MSGPGPYISAKEVKDSYRPRSNVMSPGLQRARAPFRNKNAILGVTMFGVAVGIWAYSISAVRQDTFEDLDEEARALARGPGRATTGEPNNSVIGGGSSSNIMTAGGNMTSLQTTATPLGVAAAVKDHAVAGTSTKSRGLLPSSVVDRKIPRLLDPAGKTLVWGAPPVDAVGKMGSLWKP